MSVAIKQWREAELAEFNRAREVAPYNNDALVSSLTDQMVKQGHRLFQIYRLADTDKAHVRKLMELFKLPLGAKVLDMGCGVGAMADIMRKLRPDLEIVLLNISPSQLESCPAGFYKVQGDMQAVPLESASFDAVMVCYAVGHAELWKMAGEIGRLLKPGGLALFADIFSDGYAPNITEALGYVAYNPGRLMQELSLRGIVFEQCITPKEFTLPLWILREAGGATFEGVMPMAMRYRKRGGRP